MAIGFGEDVPNPLEWIQNRFSDARRLAATFNELINRTLQDAFGPLGRPADTDAIVFVADTLADLYRDALLWSLRLRTVNVDEDFRPVATAIGDMMDDLLQQIAMLGPNVRAQIKEALAAPQTRVPRLIEMTIAISMPKDALERFNAELETLRRKLGISDY